MARKLRDARLGSASRRDRRRDKNLAEDGRTLSDQERLDEFRQSLYNNVLPNLPKIRGYHMIWLTTKNPADTIAARMRMGYELVRPEEVPGFESLSVKTGEWGNVVQVNEMIAAKLPLHLYEMYMREAHHDAPMEEEQKLLDAEEAVMEQATERAKRGKKALRIEREEGMDEIVQDRPAPQFARLTGER